MSTNTVKCFVLGDNVAVTTDINGKVTNVICPCLQRFNNSCTIKIQQNASGFDTIGGIVENLLKIRGDRKLNLKTFTCEFIDKRNIVTELFEKNQDDS